MHILTRAAFYERVWDTPLSGLADEWNTDSQWLRKLCQQAGIPLPKAGHWSRLRSGKPVARAPLPLRPPGASAIITVGHYRSWWRSPREMLSDPPPVRPEFPESVETVVNNAVMRLALPKEKAPKLPGNVSPDRRRQQIVEGLYFCLRQIGAELRISKMRRGELSLRAGETELPITLTHDPNGFSLGIQSKRAGLPQASFDDWPIPLESQWAEIVTAFMTVVEVHYRNEAIRHYEWCLERQCNAESDVRERKAEAARLWEQRRVERAQKEKARLLSQAADWRTAHDIRGFVADVLRQTETEAKRQALSPWADWALGQADLIDPIKRGSFILPPTKN